VCPLARRAAAVPQRVRVAPPAVPQRVVSFINVVGCPTFPSIGIRQNLRQVIESLTSLHKLS